jgi:hypothetical protein
MSELFVPTLQPIENDWSKNGHNHPQEELFRWNGPSVSGRKEPLSNETLAVFGSEARRLGRALTDAERAEIIDRHK